MFIVCLDRFVVHGLVTGDTYIFRVQAVNAYGLSEESQESDPLFIDAALGKHAARSYFSFILKLLCFNVDYRCQFHSIYCIRFLLKRHFKKIQHYSQHKPCC